MSWDFALGQPCTFQRSGSMGRYEAAEFPDKRAYNVLVMDGMLSLNSSYALQRGKEMQQTWTNHNSNSVVRLSARSEQMGRS